MPSLPVAQFVPRTEAEGPGRRFALWVQGCPLRCKGCCNPEMLAFKGLTESTWREDSDPNFQESETPRLVGRAVAALAADPQRHRFDGRALASWTLMDEYGFSDVDGRRSG